MSDLIPSSHDDENNQNNSNGTTRTAVNESDDVVDVDDDGQLVVYSPVKKKRKRDNNNNNIDSTNDESKDSTNGGGGGDGGSSPEKEKAKTFLSSLRGLGIINDEEHRKLELCLDFDHDDGCAWREQLEFNRSPLVLNVSTNNLIAGSTSDKQIVLDNLPLFKGPSLFRNMRFNRFFHFNAELLVKLDSAPTVLEEHSSQLIEFLAKLLRVYVDISGRCNFRVTRLDGITATIVIESVKDLEGPRPAYVKVDQPIEDIDPETGKVIADYLIQTNSFAFRSGFYLAGVSGDGNRSEINIRGNWTGELEPLHLTFEDWALNTPFVLAMAERLEYSGPNSSNFTIELCPSSVEFEPTHDDLIDFFSKVKMNNRDGSSGVSLQMFDRYDDLETPSPTFLHSVAAVVEETHCPIKSLELGYLRGTSDEYVNAAKKLLQAIENNQTTTLAPIQKLMFEVDNTEAIHSNFVLELVRRVLPQIHHLTELSITYDVHGDYVYNDDDIEAWREALDANTSLEHLELYNLWGHDFLPEETFDGFKAYLRRNKANKWASRVSAFLNNTQDPKVWSAIIPHTLKGTTEHIHKEPIVAAAVEKLHKQCWELWLHLQGVGDEVDNTTNYASEKAWELWIVLQHEDKDHDQNTMVEDEVEDEA